MGSRIFARNRRLFASGHHQRDAGFDGIDRRGHRSHRGLHFKIGISLSHGKIF